MIIDYSLGVLDLKPALERFWELSAQKIVALASSHDEADGPAVCTVGGRYRGEKKFFPPVSGRGWSHWTQGFQDGSALLQFDATRDEKFLERGRTATLEHMGLHITDFGVHDHGFNIVSTYGNLWRLMEEGRIPDERPARLLYEGALKVSGAVQARRWTELDARRGFIYSFNGPHSLFIDTVRSLRSLALAHLLGHTLREESGRSVSLLDRLKQHLVATVDYNISLGEGRDIYDVRGRVAHEALFNVMDGSYRCPSTQQGYSPFSTWTRGLAWAICGLAEELEFLRSIEDDEVTSDVVGAAKAASDYYIDVATAADGVPYWDTGAPGLTQLGDWRGAPSNPFNEQEPVDSSAAAIAAQGLMRLGDYLRDERYVSAGLTVARTLLEAPYLNEDPGHQGLLLHSVYHRPNGWDNVPAGRAGPCGESSMWGDYHIRELAVYAGRLAGGEHYNFFGGSGVGRRTH